MPVTLVVASMLAVVDGAELQNAKASCAAAAAALGGSATLCWGRLLRVGVGGVRRQ